MKFIDKDGKQIGLPISPTDYQRMAVSQIVDNTIKANSSTIQKNAIVELASMSDINDATVLATAVTRGGDAINIDGSPASGADIFFAGVGAFIPIASGSGVNKGLKIVDRTGWNHQRKQGKLGKDLLDASQASVAEAIKENISGNLPSGDPLPKRNPKGSTAKIIVGAGMALAASKETIEYFLNMIKEQNKEKDNSSNTNSSIPKNPNNNSSTIDWNRLTYPLKNTYAD